MSTSEAFLRDICENPGDDAPRLVYADWLEDHGQPRRAEFIRLSVLLAALDEWAPERPDLLDREWELLAVSRKRWQPGPSSPLGKYLHNGGFLRGFFARIELPAPVLLKHGDELFRQYPLEELRIDKVKGLLSAIAARPWLGRVSSLDLSDNELTAEDLPALFDSPHLGRLRRLTLRNVALTPEGMDQLTRWPGLSHLSHLNLGNEYRMERGAELYNVPGANWLRRLLESAHLAGLTSLTLGGLGANNDLTESDVALLAAAPSLSSLERLSVAACGISADGIRALARAPGLPKLRHLSVGWNSRGAEGLPDLMASPLLARLDALELGCSGFGAQAAAALAGSPHLGRLCSLDLTQSNIGPEEAKAIASARFGSLTELNLFNDRIGPAGMAALARSEHLARLTKLHLLGSKIGAEGMEILAPSAPLSGLRELDLGGNHLAPPGRRSWPARRTGPGFVICRYITATSAPRARTVLGSTNLAGLWSLDLSGSKMTDSTARHAAASTPLSELRRLIVDRLSERGLSEEGERALISSPRLPHLFVVDRVSRFSNRWGNVSDLVEELGKFQEQ